MARKKRERVTRLRIRVVIEGVPAGFTVNGQFAESTSDAIACAGELLVAQVKGLREGTGEPRDDDGGTT